MIEINLVRNNIPKKLDVPGRRSVLLYIFTGVFLLMLFIVGYVLFSTSPPQVKPVELHVKHSVREAEKNGSRSKVKPNPVKKKSVVNEKLSSERHRKVTYVKRKKEKEKEKEEKNKTLTVRVHVEKKVGNNKPLLLFVISVPLEKMKRGNVGVEKLALPPPPEVVKVKVIGVPNAERLKAILKSKGVSFTVKSYVLKKLSYYDVYVGGFGDYKTTVEFERALRKKGYNIYAVKNISLLYYVCIAHRVPEAVKNRYVELWRKTRFKVIAINVFSKTVYGYTFRFEIPLSFIKFLKSKGYSPIIIKGNGA